MDFRCVFWNGRTEKHQTSTARFRLAEENVQHRPFPSLACVLPHPLQNRVPRVRVLLPLPKNRRKHCVSAGFLFTCVVWLWCSHLFRQWVFSSSFIHSQPLLPSPAPKTHPVLPFFGFSGCVLCFLPFWTHKIFGPVFVHPVA